MDDAVPYRCPCGADAPADTPLYGRRPGRCGGCGSALVLPIRPGDVRFERALGGGIAAAAAAAVLWMIAGRATDGGASWMIAVGGAAIAVAARAAAGARTQRVQVAAFVSFALFLAVGEALLYRHALLGRLVAMHAAEGSPSPEILGEEEWRAMDFGKYLKIEIELAWYLGFAAALWLVWRLTRPFPAVLALGGPPRATKDGAPARLEPAPIDAGAATTASPADAG